MVRNEEPPVLRALYRPLVRAGGFFCCAGTVLHPYVTRWCNVRAMNTTEIHVTYEDSTCFWSVYDEEYLLDTGFAETVEDAIEVAKASPYAVTPVVYVEV